LRSVQCNNEITGDVVLATGAHSNGIKSEASIVEVTLLEITSGPTDKRIMVATQDVMFASNGTSK
jgi:hypothetical protein